MKEAFVSALLIIVVNREDSTRNDSGQEDGMDCPDRLISWSQPESGTLGGGSDDVGHLILWRTIKRQIRILREELDVEESPA